MLVVVAQLPLSVIPAKVISTLRLAGGISESKADNLAFRSLETGL
jgi:outer membrane murein-binding lipoprotein Lpp